MPAITMNKPNNSSRVSPAVSYTHLDVYKRQKQLHEKITHKNASVWQAEQAHHTTNKEKQGVPDGERSVVHIACLWSFAGCVRRAHPDVYKRQVEIPAMSIKREYNFDQVGDKDKMCIRDSSVPVRSTSVKS